MQVKTIFILKFVLHTYVIYFQGNLSDQGKLNTEFYMDEDDFNVMIKEISEPTYLELRDIILKFRHQKAPGIHGITAGILQKVGKAWWRRIHGLIKIIMNEEEIPVDWKKGIYKKDECNINVTITKE